MKKTLLILAVIVTSMMFSCNPEEDENNNQIYVCVVGELTFSATTATENMICIKE